MNQRRVVPRRNTQSSWKPSRSTVPRKRCTRFWRNFENLPKFMRHLDSVQITGDRRSHWRAKGPGGTTVEWDAEITDDRPNEMISWRSLENSDVYNAGTVRFQRATGGRGTIIRVDIRYAPPGGSISAAIAKLFAQDPGAADSSTIFGIEADPGDGESVVKSDASIHSGMHAGRSLRLKPAN